MKKYYISSKITIKELCNIININEFEFIKKIFLKGFILKKNEVLNFEKSKKICKDFLNIEVIEIKNNLNQLEKTNFFILSIIGNVNSGKTTLIDFIFKKNISLNEIGEITQFVSVFETIFFDKNFFIFDLPGHKIFNILIETFVNISNIIFLIISVETKIDTVYENIINLVKNKNINLIICLNKIDIVDKNLFIENYKIVKISSKNGYNVKNLIFNSVKNFDLNKIQYINLKYNGLIVNSYIFNNEFTTTIFLFKGQIVVNDFLYFTNKKIIINNIYLNNINVNSVIAPCIIKIKNIIFPINFFFSLNKSEILPHEIGNFNNFNNFNNFYLKLENHTIAISIKNYFKNLNNNINIKISLGEFTENDLNYCLNFKYKIILIGIELKNDIKKKILKNDINFKKFNLIHDVIMFLEKKTNFNKIEIKTAELIIKNIFKYKKDTTIAGCCVVNGVIEINNYVKIYKEFKLIYEGKINTLKIKSKNVDKVLKNEECGLTFKNFNDIEIGMKIISIKYNDI